jgi:hypothetical protein
LSSPNPLPRTDISLPCPSVVGWSRRSRGRVTSSWIFTVEFLVPSQENHNVFRAAQEAAEAKGELLRTQLTKVDGCVVGRAVVLRLTLASLLRFSPYLFLLAALEAELEKLRYRMASFWTMSGPTTLPWWSA